MPDIKMIVEFIQTFGFPIAVACWALWRLDKNWGKGEVMQATLEDLGDKLDRVEVLISRNTEIQTELTTTIKILHTIVTTQNYGGERRNGY